MPVASDATLKQAVVDYMLRATCACCFEGNVVEHVVKQFAAEGVDGTNIARIRANVENIFKNARGRANPLRSQGYMLEPTGEDGMWRLIKDGVRTADVAVAAATAATAAAAAAEAAAAEEAADDEEEDAGTPSTTPQAATAEAVVEAEAEAAEAPVGFPSGVPKPVAPAVSDDMLKQAVVDYMLRAGEGAPCCRGTVVNHVVQQFAAEGVERKRVEYIFKYASRGNKPLRSHGYMLEPTGVFRGMWRLIKEGVRTADVAVAAATAATAATAAEEAADDEEEDAGTPSTTPQAATAEAVVEAEAEAAEAPVGFPSGVPKPVAPAVSDDMLKQAVVDYMLRAGEGAPWCRGAVVNHVVQQFAAEGVERTRVVNLFEYASRGDKPLRLHGYMLQSSGVFGGMWRLIKEGVRTAAVAAAVSAAATHVRNGGYGAMPYWWTAAKLGSPSPSLPGGSGGDNTAAAASTASPSTPSGDRAAAPSGGGNTNTETNTNTHTSTDTGAAAVPAVGADATLMVDGEVTVWGMEDDRQILLVCSAFGDKEETFGALASQLQRTPVHVRRRFEWLMERLGRARAGTA